MTWKYQETHEGFLEGTSIPLVRRGLINNEQVYIYGGPSVNGWSFVYKHEKLSFRFELYMDGYKLYDIPDNNGILFIDNESYNLLLELSRDKLNSIYDNIVKFFGSAGLIPEMKGQNIDKVEISKSAQAVFTVEN